MKRLLSLLLCALLLCLTACTPTPDDSAADTYPPVSFASLPRLTDWENTSEDAYQINWLYHMNGYIDAEPVTLTRQHTDGSTSQVTITYQDDLYTITDDAGSRSYLHLLFWHVTGSAETDYDLAEYFLLSNDPAISPEHITENPGVIAEVAYAQYKTFDRAVSYGSVPKGFQTLLAKGLFANRATYGQTGLFAHSTIVKSSSQRPSYSIMRWSYDGTPGCKIDVDTYSSNILELKDGSFLTVHNNYSGGVDALHCYDTNGNLRWEYKFPHWGMSSYVHLLIQQEDHIYLFGTVSPNGDSDIYVGCFSLDGQLLKEQIFAGSDFDSLSQVRITDKGFQISGWTQSGDGPFPFSKDGYGVGFTAEISLDLILSNVQKSEINYANYMGMHNGQTVYSDDPIFTPDEREHLPEDVYSGRIFDYADGYVIVRAHRLAHYEFQNPVMSYLPSYVETIVTYYDADGQPVWQGVGSIYVG